jgi:hypothetical protein
MGGGSILCLEEDRWQGGPAQAFVLGPGHRVVFADTSISVTHGDEEQRTPILMERGAAELLPIQYTPLTVSRPTGTRRHFFHWFFWMPDDRAKPSSWTLAWTLSEVAGDAWIPVAHEKELVTVSGSRRPESIDLAKHVRLRVNASGEAELTIVTGTSARTEIIPWKGKQ